MATCSSHQSPRGHRHRPIEFPKEVQLVGSSAHGPYFNLRKLTLQRIFYYHYLACTILYVQAIYFDCVTRSPRRADVVIPPTLTKLQYGLCSRPLLGDTSDPETSDPDSIRPTGDPTEEIVRKQYPNRDLAPWQHTSREI